MTIAAKVMRSFADIQMAAEATRLGEVIAGTLSLKDALVFGNNRSSKFTSVQADEFSQLWEVVEHKSNTSTGFSGTLFRAKQGAPAELLTRYGIAAGELVLSFRSTEFADDAVRDNQATNTLEISEEGWAFGQIADMEEWFASLKRDNKIPSGASYSVTGYSLGGHLATAFNLLRGRDGTHGQIAGTYTFNGAGVGNISNLQSLNNLIADFDRMRKNASGNEITFTEPDAQAAYAELRPAFGADASLSAALIRSEAARIERMRSRLNPDDAGLPIYFPTRRNAELGTLQRALERIASIQAEAERVATLTSGNGNNPVDIQGSANIEALRLDYQLAVLKASEQTAASAGVIGGAYQAIAGRDAVKPPIRAFYDIYGSDFGIINYSAVANSQRHFGAEVPIFIEDQPLFRGTVLTNVGSESWKAGEVKLLVPDFVNNDFGDTHSLVLLVDSLAVQHTLAQLDPAATQATLTALLKASHNGEGTSVAGGQGNADGHTLEAVVNTLGAYFGVDKEGNDWVKLKGNSTGGTWAEMNRVGDYTGREALHKNLDLIVKSPRFQQLAGKVDMKVADIGLAQEAKSDFGALVALQALSPLVLKAKADKPGSQASLEVLWSHAWANEYALWKADRAAQTAGQDAINYTDSWLADRAELLKWNRSRNISNIEEVRSPGVTQATIYSDLATSLLFSVANTHISPQALLEGRRVTFGGDGNETLTGQAKGDSLYGGKGEDEIRGLEGNDHLEGNAGADTLDGGVGADILVGGAGSDTYLFTGDFGRDEIIDSDGLGQIKIDGNVVSGQGKVETLANASQPYTVWTDKDHAAGLISYRFDTVSKNLMISTAKGSITVRNFKSGDLGITAPTQPSAPPPAPQPQSVFNLALEGQRDSFIASNSGEATQDLYVQNAVLPPGEDELGIVRTGTGADLVEGGLEKLDTKLLLAAGAGKDRIYATQLSSLEDAIARGDSAEVPALNDSYLVLDGAQGDDVVVGGDGWDALFGGEEDDTLVGGQGGDVIFADGIAGGMLEGHVQWQLGLVNGFNNAATGMVSTLTVEHAGIHVGLTEADSTGRRQSVYAHRTYEINPLSSVSFAALEQFQNTDIRGQGYVLGDGTALTPDQSMGEEARYSGSGRAFQSNIGNGRDLIFAGAGQSL